MESPEETSPPVHPHEGKHTPFFSSTCEDTIWEINYNTQEPEIYSCEDYKGWGYCDADWMEGWCQKTCEKCCEDHLWEINYNTQETEIYSCEDYKGWGYCDADWMQGWCELTCDRCSEPVAVD